MAKPYSQIAKLPYDHAMSGKLTLNDLDIGVLNRPLVLIKDDLHCDGHFVVLASVRQALSSGRKVCPQHCRAGQSLTNASRAVSLPAGGTCTPQVAAVTLPGLPQTRGAHLDSFRRCCTPCRL